MEEETLGACRVIEMLSEIGCAHAGLILEKRLNKGCVVRNNYYLQLPTAPPRCHVL
jgi:hypothetical protein